MLSLSLRMAYCLQATQILSTGSTIKSLRSPLMAKDCRYCREQLFYLYSYFFTLIFLICLIFAGDCLFGHSAFVWRKEVVRAHHALSHLGRPEGGGLCPRNCPPRGRAHQSQGRSPLGTSGQESHPGEFHHVGLQTNFMLRQIHLFHG